MDDKSFTAIVIILAVGVLIWKYILKPLRSIYKMMFPKLEGLALKTSEEMKDIRKVQLFNIADIDMDYTVLGMIESFDTNKIQAKEKLQLEALTIGANAVINVSTNIDNNVKGSVGSVATMPKMISGKTSTITTYHYEGTAVKLKEKA